MRPLYVCFALVVLVFTACKKDNILNEDDAGNQAVVINELLASNSNSIADPSNEYDDWIELYNTTNSVIDLSGYFLSNDAENIQKWSFPAGTIIGANDYLMIWADEDLDQPGLHASFKLKKSGATLFFSNPQETILNETTYKDQVSDVSWGRYENGTGPFIQMNPTYKSKNSGPYSDPNNGRDSTIGNKVFDDMILHEIVVNMSPDDRTKMLDEAWAEEYFQAEFSFDGELVGNVGIRVKGDGSIEEAMASGGNAFPFKIDFNRYEPNLEFDGLTKINLHTELNLSSVVYEYLSYSIIREWNVPTARVSLAVLTMNGEDLGLYTIVEQISGKFIKENFPEPHGHLYKFYRDPGFLNDVDNVAGYADESLKWPDNSDHNSFTNFLQSINSGSIDEYLAVVDVKRQLRYMAANVGVANSDFYGNSPENYYLYEISPEVYTMIPWDMNQSQNNDSRPFGPMIMDDEWPMIRPLLHIDEYRQQYFGYLLEFLNGPASEQNTLAKLDQFELVVGDRIDQVQDRVNETRADIKQRVSEMLNAINDELE